MTMAGRTRSARLAFRHYPRNRLAPSRQAIEHVQDCVLLGLTEAFSQAHPLQKPMQQRLNLFLTFPLGYEQRCLFA